MLRNKFKDYTIILASGSPRRQQFFKEFDVDFEIRLREVDEVYPDHLQFLEITDYLAQLKASAFEGDLKPNEILVTSDTLVWHNGVALGKPKDYEDAFQMLQLLVNTTHEVITSVCFKTTEKEEIINEITKVTFGAVSDDAIHYYLENYKPFDKAGSYGIQDWIGLIGISKIEGSYTNVVGLPTEKVFQYLLKL